MKKYILSGLTISTFLIYVLYQQVTGSGNAAVFINPNTTGTKSIVTNTVANSPVVKQNNNQTQPQSTPVVQVNVPVAIKPKSPVVIKSLYADGRYTGVSADAYYGNIQVQITIAGGKLTNVQFLDHPQDRNTSVRINNYAMPVLASEAIKSQSANVNTVSGATDSSGAFRQSLDSALTQAKNS